MNNSIKIHIGAILIPDKILSITQLFFQVHLQPSGNPNQDNIENLLKITVIKDISKQIWAITTTKNYIY